MYCGGEAFTVFALRHNKNTELSKYCHIVRSGNARNHNWTKSSVQRNNIQMIEYKTCCVYVMRAYCVHVVPMGTYMRYVYTMAGGGQSCSVMYSEQHILAYSQSIAPMDLFICTIREHQGQPKQTPMNMMYEWMIVGRLWLGRIGTLYT